MSENRRGLRIPPLQYLLLFVPVAGVLELTHANPTWIFATSALAIIPLAGLMGMATEALAERTGPGLGGLLNASFGNAAELIIAFMALQRGLYDVVKASITGSIIGNVLLVLGLSIVFGGYKYERLRFNATAAHAGSTLLALSAIGLVVPAVFHRIVAMHGESSTGFAHEHELSLEIAIVLFLTYIASLWFSLRTHKHLYAGDSAAADTGASGRHAHASAGGRHAHATAAGHATDNVGGHGSGHGPGWSVARSLWVLLGATALVALMSEFLVGAVEHTAAAFGMTEVFIGVILVAIIGNAAEHSTAILVARKNQMDLALNIAVGSSIQVALFVAPVLVFASYIFGRPMDLLFTPFEVLAVVASVFVLNLVCADGEAHWLEGVQLLAVYVILALAFFFLP